MKSFQNILTEKNTFTQCRLEKICRNVVTGEKITASITVFLSIKIHHFDFLFELFPLARHMEPIVIQFQDFKTNFMK